MSPLVFIGLERPAQMEVMYKVIYHKNDDKIAYVIDMVYHYLNVDKTHIKSKLNERPLVEARQIAMYIVRKYLKSAFKTIGQYFGGRTHASAMYGIETVSDMISTDKVFKAKIQDLESWLKVNCMDFF